MVLKGSRREFTIVLQQKIGRGHYIPHIAIRELEIRGDKIKHHVRHESFYQDNQNLIESITSQLRRWLEVNDHNQTSISTDNELAAAIADASNR